MAKLPLPQILRGLRGREQAKPQERGARLKGQSFCRARELGCLLHLCQITQPALPLPGLCTPGPEWCRASLRGCGGGPRLRLICEGWLAHSCITRRVLGTQ